MRRRTDISADYQSEAALVRAAFGEVIEKHRIDAEYDQRPFSRIVGISNSHLRKIEDGEVAPTIITVWKIASVLQIDPGTLVAEANEVVLIRKSQQERKVIAGPKGR